MSLIADDELLTTLGDWVRVDGGHWIWTRASAHGYGKCSPSRWGMGERLAYRAVWKLSGRRLPAYTPTGPQLDHTCRVRLCVRPSCMELVTPLENQLRGLNGEVRRSGSCRAGHVLDEVGVTARGKCAECKRSRDRRYVRRRTTDPTRGQAWREAHRKAA